jgi:hypothetical protein
MHRYLIHRHSRYRCQVLAAAIFSPFAPDRIAARIESSRSADSVGEGPMSVSIPSRKQSEIVYPESDGKPIADNTLQFQWIVTIKEGLARAFSARPDVFVAGDLLFGRAGDFTSTS